jgi:hypothetical protein
MQKAKIKINAKILINPIREAKKFRLREDTDSDPDFQQLRYGTVQYINS